MTTLDDRDRLIDTLLAEILGGETPPDLREQILRRAARGRRAREWLAVGLAGALLIAIGTRIVLEPTARRDQSQSAAPEPVIRSPLPPEAQGFQGFLAGTILSADDTSFIFKITHSSPGPSNKSLTPRWLEGRTAHLLIIRFGGQVSQEMLRQAVKLKEYDGLVTADVWAERDEALIVTRLREGDATDR